MSDPLAEPEAEPEPFVWSDEVVREFINELVTAISDSLICSTIAEALVQVSHEFDDAQLEEYMVETRARNVRARRLL